MASTDLKLDEPGSLPRPGPLGRLVRLALGIACAWYVQGLIDISSRLIDSGGHIASVLWNATGIGLFLISYVINIGFSRSWKKWPAFVSAALFLVVAGSSYFTAGIIETQLLARTMWVWSAYLYTHLGLYLYSRITGIPTKEHYCPVGPLHPIDQWEAGRPRS
jgi:hypothetical protein